MGWYSVKKKELDKENMDMSKPWGWDGEGFGSLVIAYYNNSKIYIVMAELLKDFTYAVKMGGIMVITSLVGYSGFVGSNLSEQSNFKNLYNSKNIIDAFGTKPDLLIYSGVRAEKFLANKEPKNDFEIVKNAFENIKKINPKQIVLISTIDVYQKTVDVNENAPIDTYNLHPYGLNRHYLEQWVQNEFKNNLIVRLPGLYGKNIKKNFIYDIISFIPAMLSETKFREICNKEGSINDYYTRMENGFYKCKSLNENETSNLKAFFKSIKFSALNFTDSRATFQFYNLSFLWRHIELALSKGIKTINISTEPISASEIYKHVNKVEYINEVAEVIPYYNIKTIYAEVFGGQNGYIYNKDFVLEDIKRFVEGYSK